MDIIEANLVNAIREIVKQELANALPNQSDKFMTRADVESFMEMDGYSYISDEVDDAVRQVVRNELTVEINI